MSRVSGSERSRAPRGAARLRLPLLLALAVPAGCSAPGDSVLLISIDSLRHEQIRAHADGRPVSPVLAAFAEEAVVYERAVSPAPWTTPSAMSLLTGLPVPAHGVDEHDRALAASVEVLGERFQRGGYRTAAVVPAPTLRPEYGFARGFDEYQYQDFGHFRRSSPKMTSRVLHLLEQWKDEPFFIWVHLWDPHYNYNPPPPWNTTFDRGAKPEREDVQCLKWVENPVSAEEAEYFVGQYQGEIGYTDEYVAQMLEQLDRLGIDKRTVVAITADHGESFLEHGYLGHTNRLDETLIHVPLMIRRAGRVNPGTVTEVVGTARLGRTLLGLSGLAADDFGLLPALPLEERKDGEGEPLAVLSETRRRGCFTAISSTRYKAVVDHRTCQWQLFDVREDPGERRNLAAESVEQLGALQGELSRQLAAIDAEKIPHAALPREIVEQAEQQLRAIGYLGGPAEDGTRGVVCDLRPHGAGVDAFGDALGAEPCPWETARECLAALPAAQPE